MTTPLIVKLVLVSLLVFIIFNLGRALFIMVKGQHQQSMSQYLGRRVLFSVVVIVVLLVALGLGYIQPNTRPY
ncbi:DUF2909 domain-containing protein [Shewanella inventionis]|uniref:DUF2909 domain-containing protein n=3 Tax=Shewanella TaxID=22 RepID=A0ABQ2Q2H3_9GAMM|nr:MULTISPECIES: DUF2909 domain-containing protein [Shewanella]MCL1101044.1 DUF2909 domain-containing protein [Shewanella saliphila]MCL1156406.1 DUF2909 domain-containing protein [Shewanella inventionis]MCT8988514.1 DUF2909 domain-containing protein [Shewanella sp. KJ10-1]UAL43430.1 DUF2909 domain-containing protein [Shewanella inventionis]GGB45273.1 hypothetical protein GCM10011607_01680 [Shewanella inventionis]